MHARHPSVGDYANGMPAALLHGARWRKSGHSNANGECVELAELADGQIAVRNSRFPEGPALLYTRAEIAAFLAGAKSGDFDDLVQASPTHDPANLLGQHTSPDLDMA